MKKRIIQDIRLYKCGIQTESGNSVTTSFADKKLNAMVHRVVMKLRENQFSLGEFDHLYIQFTTFDLADKITLSEEVDRYHPWYRYCTVPVERELWNNLRAPESYESIMYWIRTVLVTYFATAEFDQERILSCVQQALEQGEDMLMHYKEKVSARHRAVVYLRYLDSCRFYPLLRVYDKEDRLLLEKDLPQALTLDYLGEIQVSAKRVTIKPRKNAFTAQMSPLVLEY